MIGEPTILVVDDEEELRRAIAQGLDLAGYEVETYSHAAPVIERVDRIFNGVVISDIRMPKVDGMALMKSLLDVDAALPVILVTGHGDVPLAVEAMKAGAYDFIEKPFQPNQLTNVVGRALEKRRLTLENRALRSQLTDRSSLEATIVGRSPEIERVREQVAALSKADADILLIGETGTGKDVVARALHTEGTRADAPFMAINCGALPTEIIESELFGHEAGAFTGASKSRTGKLEHADGGTVFLDEIESMPLDLQVKLLRAIENRSIERLGSNEPRVLDVRFIAASKVDLEQASANGAFRQDLFYRLNVVTIDIPPLRERKQDIPHLFQFLTIDARARYRREIPEVTSEILSALMAHEWPGNVRELRNTADRFVLGMWSPPGAEHTGSNDTAGTLFDRVSDFEKSLIEAELARQGGRLKPTYEALGLSRKTLYDKMKKYGLDRHAAIEDV